jgi:predicted HicB family RNase H-like nuclease
MNNSVSYKGFVGSVNFDFNKNLVYGKIENVQDVVEYKTEFAAKVKNEFIKAVKKYIRDCKQENKRIIKLYNGHFKLHVTSELYQKAASLASTKGISLNKLIQKVIQKEIENIS